MLDWREYTADIYALDSITHPYVWDCGGMVFTGTQETPVQRVRPCEFDTVTERLTARPDHHATVEIAFYDYGCLFTKCAVDDATYFTDEECVYHRKMTDVGTYDPSTTEYIVLESVDMESRPCILTQATLEDRIADGTLTPIQRIT